MTRRRARNLEIHAGHREMAEDLVHAFGRAQALRTLERWAVGDQRYLAVIDAIHEMPSDPETVPTEVTS